MKNVTLFERPADASLEWVGGVVLSPFYITKGTPYRPDMILWIEMPEGAVVSFVIEQPREEEEAGAFGKSLVAAMETPMYGDPRRPSVVRVVNSMLAAEVRRILPRVRIVVAPTPEVTEVIEAMRSAPPPDPKRGGGGSEKSSYFEGGRVGVATIEAMFRAADTLYRAAPWKSAVESELFRVDIPAYGIDGACLSIIGALGHHTGIVLFPSIDGYERFAALGDTHDLDAEPPSGTIDMGTPTLALTFHSGAELPDGMYREALKHHWPVSGAQTYPMVEHRDHDAVPRPLTERDFETMAACARSLAEFCLEHQARFELDSFDETIRETYQTDGNVVVQLTAPFEEGPVREFEVKNAASTTTLQATLPTTPPATLPSTATSTSTSAPKPGRNETCPCGSGKKYKNCCLKREVAELALQSSSAAASVSPLASHEVDARLCRHVGRYATQRFGAIWRDLADEAFVDPPHPASLWVQWALFHQLVNGKTCAQWYFEAYDDRLAGIDRAWLEAQLAAWLSIWEVVEVEPGRSVTLVDLLTGETRLVLEKSASKSLVKRHAVLARIVDFQGYSVFCGMYDRVLTPMDAAEVVDEVRARLRRKSAVPIDRLRPERIGRLMIEGWEDALEESEMRAGNSPTLQNTDGDPLLVTTDHFEFDPATRSEIQRRLACLEGVEPSAQDDGPDQSFVFGKPGNAVHKSWTNTIIATATLSGGTLRVETNSVKRSDAMRKLVESSLGSLIRHRARTHADPLSTFNPPQTRARSLLSGGPSAALPPSEELDRVLLAVKAQHYSDWLDEPIPLLGDKTPRAAVRTNSGRAEVDLLLKESEYRESRLPKSQRFDFSSIRRELGLDG